MDKIKPSEVSEVLLQQLNSLGTEQNFDEVGTVLTVSDGVARIYGLRNAEANELLEFENGTMAIVMNLEEDNVGCVLSLKPNYAILLCKSGAMCQAITIAIIAALYWFFGTELGASIRATGANGNMARAQGINTNFNIVLGLALANGLVALSGALLCQYQGFAEINMGRGAIVIGLAAIIIGEVAFGKIFRNFALRLLAVSIGAILYYMVVQFVVSVLAINTNYLKLFSALIVAVFLAVPYWKQQYFHKKAKEGHHA